MEILSMMVRLVLVASGVGFMVGMIAYLTRLYKLEGLYKTLDGLLALGLALCMGAFMEASNSESLVFEKSIFAVLLFTGLFYGYRKGIHIGEKDYLFYKTKPVVEKKTIREYVVDFIMICLALVFLMKQSIHKFFKRYDYIYKTQFLAAASRSP